MEERKLFCCWYNNEKHYTHAVTKEQAAVALGNKLDVFIRPEYVNEVKTVNKYKFAYRSDYNYSTRYIYIYAVSERQAWFFFKNYAGSPYFKELQKIVVPDKGDVKPTGTIEEI